MQYRRTEEIYIDYLNSGQKVCTDTRKIEKGSVFYALKGANFNANTFAAKAIEQGCSCAIVDEEQYADNEKIFFVKDTLESLQDLARLHRSKLDIPFLAITGSNAKTTTKELIAAVLSKKFSVLATAGNLNNHIGVPLTILSITSEHTFAVIEMGANHQGEIAMLCSIADPGFGMITNIGKAHLEGFGGEEGVKKGKGELYAHLRNRNGKVFINGDDAVLCEMALNNDKITYGCKKLYDVIGKDHTTAETVSFKFTTRYGEKDFNKLPLITTHMVGAYNLVNCLAAACVGNYFKVDDELIREALSAYVPEMNRSQLLKTGKNTIILDAYNANPDSMKVALQNFSKYPGSNKLVLLGDMFELGDYSATEHKAIVSLLSELHLDNSIMVGEEFSKIDTKGYRTFKTTQACRDFLEQQKIEGATILIKGSRGMKMEQLREVL
jgi:UDP-N-acetylmuramoyl-tripeptide--D-alanyl-D-alanine ligase